MSDLSSPDTLHGACDRRIAELEAEVESLRAKHDQSDYWKRGYEGALERVGYLETEMESLRAIVRDLAAADPIKSLEGWNWCVCCMLTHDSGPIDPNNHFDDCVWKRAHDRVV